MQWSCFKHWAVTMQLAKTLCGHSNSDLQQHKPWNLTLVTHGTSVKNQTTVSPIDFSNTDLSFFFCFQHVPVARMRQIIRTWPIALEFPPDKCKLNTKQEMLLRGTRVSPSHLQAMSLPTYHKTRVSSSFWCLSDQGRSGLLKVLDSSDFSTLRTYIWRSRLL